MSLIAAIILGIVQGVTEFIPVSSSGHLVLVGKVVDIGNHFTFDILLNIGTLAALVWYARHQLKELLLKVVNGNLSLLTKLGTATTPAVIAGLLFSDFFKEQNTNIWLVVIMLVVVGLLMVFIKHAKKPLKKLEEISYTSALIIGLAQAIALIPGTSRSGITILAALLIGYSRKLSAEWSFVMAVPIVFGAVAKTLFSREGLELINDNFIEVFIGNIASFIVGLLAIDYLFKILKKHDLEIFGYYRIGLGVILAALLLTDII